MGASPPGSIGDGLCGGEDSQHHIIRECTHKPCPEDILACRTKRVQLLRRRSSDRSERAHRSLLKFYLDFALQVDEASGAFTAWTGILDNRQITKLKTVEDVHAVEV